MVRHATLPLRGVITVTPLKYRGVPETSARPHSALRHLPLPPHPPHPLSCSLMAATARQHRGDRNSAAAPCSSAPLRSTPFGSAQPRRHCGRPAVRDGERRAGAELPRPAPPPPGCGGGSAGTAQGSRPLPQLRCWACAGVAACALRSPAVSLLRWRRPEETLGAPLIFCWFVCFPGVRVFFAFPRAHRGGRRWARSEAGKAVHFQPTWEENLMKTCTEAGTDFKRALTWDFSLHSC